MTLEQDRPQWPRAAVVLMVLLALCWSQTASGQSLAAVARETEAKRKASGASGKVYTNESLAPAPPVTARPAAEASTDSTAGKSASAADESADAEEDAAAEAPRDEAYWKKRVQAQRDQLARAQSFAAALQSQINGLYAEFTACDTPMQCNEARLKRDSSIAELDRVKTEVEDHTKAVATIQEEARRAGVPAGWVR
jgi:hypothetical protein